MGRGIKILVVFLLIASLTGVLFVDISGDGLVVSEEIYYGTDPTVKDTTGDGLSDWDEIHKYGTDPTVKDTTGDGLTDWDEIHKYGTDPTVKDTTGDGLTDWDEIHKYGTDPTVKDTSGDGFTDVISIHGDEINHDVYADIDPLKKDVVIEITLMEGTDVTQSEIDDIKTAFSEAPIQNPDGTSGITMHVISTETKSPFEEQTEYDGYLQNQYQNDFETHGYGTRHVFIVDDARIDGVDVGGATQLSSDGMIVQYYEEDRILSGPIIMHELGHALGIGTQHHDGVDSTKYSATEYPSIMNYNYYQSCLFFQSCGDDRDLYQFSDGTNGDNDFNDWEQINKSMGVGLNKTIINEEIHTKVND